MRGVLARVGSRSGATLVELLVVVAVIALLIGLLLPALSSLRERGDSLRCSANLRAIHQGLAAWGQSHDGSYPRPDLLDKSNNTELTPPGGGEPRTAFPSKNRTGTICSVLVYNETLSREIWVCPSEPGNIRPIHEDEYDFRLPDTAVNPSKAVWDPAFKGTPSPADDSVPLSAVPAGVGNDSYAHCPVVSQWLSYWGTHLAAPTQPIFGDRGPKYSTTTEPGTGEWALDAAHPAQGVDSLTLRSHAPRSAWAGNVVYNDGHARFERAANPAALRIAYNGGQFRDNLFVVEPVPPALGSGYPANALLRHWKRGVRAEPADGDWGAAVNAMNAPGHLYVWVDGMAQ